MMMSNLPHDLIEEILARVPLTSLRAVRFTCKKWNALTKDRNFTDKHIVKTTASGEREYLMIRDDSVYLISFNLHGFHKNFGLSIKCKGKLVKMDNSDKLFFTTQFIHCNCLLLCLRKKDRDINRLVVWNPFTGKSKWIEPRDTYGSFDRFFLGYDKSCGSHKVLRLFDFNKFEIYSLSSNSWMVSNVTFEWYLLSKTLNMSLKGNTYWLVRDIESRNCYLTCFDFTRERFIPHLYTPFNISDATFSVSVVKEEQLAVLVQRWQTLEIWVTSKIEPDAVSWSNFLKVNMQLSCICNDFFIDEEKNVAVVISDKTDVLKLSCNVAYIIEDKLNFRKVDFGSYNQVRHKQVG